MAYITREWILAFAGMTRYFSLSFPRRRESIFYNMKRLIYDLVQYNVTGKKPLHKRFDFMGRENCKRNASL